MLVANIQNAFVALAFAVIIWDGLRSGRVLFLGPERRHAPISFWLAQLVLFAAVAVNLGLIAFRLWAVEIFHS